MRQLVRNIALHLRQRFLPGRNRHQDRAQIGPGLTALPIPSGQEQRALQIVERGVQVNLYTRGRGAASSSLTRTSAARATLKADWA